MNAGVNWHYTTVKEQVLSWFNHEQHLKNTIRKLYKAGGISPASSNEQVIDALQKHIENKRAAIADKFYLEESGDGSDYATGEDIADSDDPGFGGV